MEQFKALPEELAIHKSPDKIDQAVRLVRPRQIIFIASIVVLLLMALIWCFVARIPVYVYGKGILINESGISEIKTQFPGKISQLHVRIGQRIEQGEVLATVEQLDLMFDVRKLESQLKEVRGNLDWLLENADEQVRNVSIRKLQTDIARYQRELKNLHPTSEFYDMEKSELEKARQEAMIRLFDLTNYRMERVFEFRNTLLTFNSELQFKKNQLANQAQIVSPYSGTVIDMSFNVGDIFTAGNTFLVIENENYQKDELIALVYLNAKEGKKVKTGMEVQLAPSTIPPEEHGFMLGSVNYISKYTLTEAGMNRVLRNNKVVEELSKDGLPMVVQVRLNKDSTTFTKYKWTTQRGPATEVISGTLVRANIISEEKRPISFIIPFL